MGWLSFLYPNSSPYKAAPRHYDEASRREMVAQSEKNMQALLAGCEEIIREKFIPGEAGEKIRLKQTIGREVEFVAFTSDPDAVEARLNQLLDALKDMRHRIASVCHARLRPAEFDNNAPLKEAVKELFRSADSPEELDVAVGEALRLAAQEKTHTAAVNKVQNFLMRKYGDMDIENENTDFMQVDLHTLDDAFDVTKKHPKMHVRERTKLVEEYTLGMHLAHDPRLGKEGHYRQPGIAMVQLEVISYPHSSPVAASRWGFEIARHIRESAQEYGFDRIRFSTKADANVLASGTHLNIVLWAEIEKADGTAEMVNLMEAKGLARITGKPANAVPVQAAATPLSELALCCGKAINEYLRHSMLLFAPADESYVRFTPDEIIGPAFGGFTDRKKRGGMGTAMFRGGGRCTSRVESHYADKVDGGPVRLEMRWISNEASGLGFEPTSIEIEGKTIEYGNMRPLAAFSMEAANKIIADGFDLWHARQSPEAGEAYLLKKLGYVQKDGEALVKNGKIQESEAAIYLQERERKLRGDVFGELTEAILLQERFNLPHRKNEAEKKFMGSSEAEAYWGERKEQIVDLGNEIDRRMALEYTRHDERSKSMPSRY